MKHDRLIDLFYLRLTESLELAREDLSNIASLTQSDDLYRLLSELQSVSYSIDKALDKGGLEDEISADGIDDLDCNLSLDDWLRSHK